MSLFRSRVKILGQIPHKHIISPRSASAQIGIRLNHSVVDLTGIKNAGETQDREVQKSQITISRSLFSLFRKKETSSPEDITNATLQNKKDQSWLTKMFAKPSKATTPQERCMMKAREMQRKQEIGFIKVPTQDWKPSVMINTKDNHVSKPKLSVIPAPPPTLQPVPPPSVETRLMELHKKHNTSPQHSEIEMNMHKYIPRLPYSEFKPQRKEIPQKFCMEKYEIKKTPASDVGVRKKSTSARGHRRMDRKFSWYSLHSFETPERAFANIQSNKALMHTGRKNVQYFTHRNYIDSQSHGKIKGHSLQSQVKKRKLLAQIHNKIPSNAFCIDNNKHKQFSDSLNLDTKSNTLESPLLYFTAKSLTQIPKISTASPNGTVIKHINNVNRKIPQVLNEASRSDRTNTTGEVGPNLLKSKRERLSKEMSPKNEKTTHTIQQLNVQNKEARCMKHPNIKGSVLCDSVSASQNCLTNFVDTTSNKSSKISNHITKKWEDSHKHEEVKISNNIEKDQNCNSVGKLELRKWMKRIKDKERILRQNNANLKKLENPHEIELKQTTLLNKDKYINHDNTLKGISNKTFHTQIQNPPNKKVNNKMHKKSTESQSALIQQQVKKVSMPLAKPLFHSSNPCTILPIPRKPLWRNVTLHTEAQAKTNVTKEKMKDYCEYLVPQAQIHPSNSLVMLQKMSSHAKQTESSNKSGIENNTYIKDKLTAQDKLRNVISTSKSVLSNTKQEPSVSQHGNTPVERFHDKHKTQENMTEIKEMNSISESARTSNERQEKHLQLTTAGDNNVLKEADTPSKNPYFIQKTDKTTGEIFKGNVHDLHISDIRNIQIAPERDGYSVTESINSPVRNKDSKEKYYFSLRTTANSISNTSYNEKNSELEDKMKLTDISSTKIQARVSDMTNRASENEIQDKNKCHKSDDQVTCLSVQIKEPVKSQETESDDKFFARSPREDRIDDYEELEANINGRKRENLTSKFIQSEPVPSLDMKGTELLTLNNFNQDCSSQAYSSPRFIYDTIQSKFRNGLVPVETYNSILNKSWTLKDFAAYFYGATFSKQDLLNKHVHKVLGFDEKVCHSALLENTMTNTSNEIINNMNADQIPTQIGVENSYKPEESQNKLTHNEIKIDEVLVRKSTTNCVVEPSNNIINMKTNNTCTTDKYNSENKQIPAKREESKLQSQYSINTVEPHSLTNSCTALIQCSSTKRNYSSWSIREPSNFNQSSYKCKSKKKEEKPTKKGEKPKPEVKPYVCERKDKKRVCKKIGLPGCQLRPLKSCQEIGTEALPCIKKEAPSPSFSECLQYPLKVAKFTECDCTALKGRKDCTMGYEAPKQYDKCKREMREKPKTKRSIEEEIENVDEGQFPCDK